MTTDARYARTTLLRSNGGFTLLELTIVIAIVAVLMGIAIPRLRDTGSTKLRSESHRLAMTFKLVRSEAILQGIPFQMNFDLDEQRYWITSADPLGGQDATASLGRLARGFQLDPEVGFSDVMLPAAGAKVNSGQIYTIFYPDGTVDATVIHLATASQAYTLHLNPMSSGLVMTPGYVVPRYGGPQ